MSSADNYFRGGMLPSVSDVSGGLSDHAVAQIACYVRLDAARAGYQPRSRHSARFGRSAPNVVSSPWPG
jgi:hypothetical protein